MQDIRIQFGCQQGRKKSLSFVVDRPSMTLLLTSGLEGNSSIININTIYNWQLNTFALQYIYIRHFMFSAG